MVEAERLTLQMFNFPPSELVVLFERCVEQTQSTPASDKLKPSYMGRTFNLRSPPDINTVD